MKKLLSVLMCIMILLVPLYSYADPKTEIVIEGEKVPYTGTLLNEEALAKILAETEYRKEKCELDKEYIKKTKDLECSEQVESLKLDVDIIEKKHDLMMDAKNTEIQNLHDIIKKESKNKPNKILWYIGGILTGIAISVGTVYAINKVSD